MVYLRIFIVFLTLLSIFCLVRGILFKRKNVGFILTAVIIVACNVICNFLFNIANAREAGKVLMPYYILHAWLFFMFLLMILMIDRFKNAFAALIPSAIVCIYQTYLVVSQYFGARILSFAKRIYFRTAWWVATDTKNTGIFFSYRSYRLSLYLNLIIIICALAVCIWKSNKIFRTRYFWIMAMIGFCFAAEVITVNFQLPIWIISIIYNIILALFMYFTAYYMNSRLREWSLDSFANDMSDGLILYNKYDDLIHINDMVKNTLHEGLLDDFRDRTKLEEWLSGKTSIEHIEVVKYKNADREYYFKVGIRELGGHGSPVGTLYILHDNTGSITRIKAMEEANAELERANRMKSDFLANMSHEIRTPMNAVIGMAEIALREDNSPHVEDYLRQIQNSGKNLLNIINDILDYSKIESGKMEIVEDDYEPFEELSDIANVLGTRIGDKDLQVFILVETALPHKLRGDAMRIRQVLINLANNAIKFTAKGFVRIHIRCEELSPDMVDMRFHVIDTGIGIKEEDLDKLFESFQQVDSRRNRSVEGTGLGLAISQKLVEAMNGEIGVSSEFGKGSDFWFNVPQQVVSAENDLLIKDADSRHAVIYCDDPEVVNTFNDEMDRLKVSHGNITDVAGYVPSGKKDYLFFTERYYTDGVERLLKDNKDVNGIILVDLASEFTTDIPNLHIFRRPESTMGMVKMLNDRFGEIEKSDDTKTFKPDFTAPDAKVLVVDDNAINLTIAEGLLAPLKLKIDTAGGGQEAIDKVVSGDYDVVLMDHMMPGIDGVDATRTIKERVGSGKCPIIIALSANAMEEARRLFDEAGMSDFVAKPIDVRILTSKLKQWLPADKIVERDPNAVDDEDSADEIRIDIEGLDLDTAVNALGSTVLYDRIAGEYYRSGNEKLEGIRQAYESKDWPDYTIRVHALKSSSRQIGAMELGSMAEALEKAGKADDIDTIMADTDRTLEAFKELLDKLAPYYAEDETDDSDKPAIDAQTLTSLLDDLEKACDDLDMDAMEEVSESLKKYSYDENAAGLIASLQKAISDMDTDVCMEIAQKLHNL